MHQLEDVLQFLDETSTCIYNVLQGIHHNNWKLCFDSLDALNMQIYKIAEVTIHRREDLTSHQRGSIFDCHHKLFIIWTNARLVARKIFHNQNNHPEQNDTSTQGPVL